MCIPVNFVIIYLFRMKFVIKSGSTVKLYSGDLKIEALAQFLKENFASWNSNNLTYTDQDADKITIATQEDLDALFAMNPESRFIKLQLHADHQPLTDQILNSQTLKIMEQIHDDNQQKPSDPNQIKDQILQKRKSKKKKSQSKPQSERKKGKASQKKEEISKDMPDLSQESASQSSSEEKIRMIERLITKKIVETVDRRINSLIPCLKEKVHNNQQEYTVIQNQELEHKGVTCLGCNMNPIIGIRYKCLECLSFSLCFKCEQKIDHEHNLLKMKKIQERSPINRDQKFLYKLGKKFLHRMKKNHSSTDSEGQKNSNHRRHWRGKRKHGQQGCGEHKINRKLFKLKALFGERQNFREFLSKHSDLKRWQLVELYAAQNNISSEDLQRRRDKIRKQKLAAFYDCPEEEFQKVVKTYPKLNFREIIMKLNQLGERTYSGENFKKMREKFRNCRRERSVQKYKVSREKAKFSEGSYDKKHKAQMKNEELSKKSLMASMEQLFGKEKNGQYRRFIDENIELSVEEIIGKWIEKLSY